MVIAGTTWAAFGPPWAVASADQLVGDDAVALLDLLHVSTARASGRSVFSAAGFFFMVVLRGFFGVFCFVWAVVRGRIGVLVVIGIPAVVGLVTVWGWLLIIIIIGVIVLFVFAFAG